MTFDEKINKFKLRLIERAFRQSNGNVTEAAKILGVNRTTLTMRLKALGLKQKYMPKFIPKPIEPTAEGNTDYGGW